MYWQDFHRDTSQLMVENQKLLEKIFLIYLGLEYLIANYGADLQIWAIGRENWILYWGISLLFGLAVSCLRMGLVRQICLLCQKDPVRKRDLFLYWNPSNIHKTILLIGSITVVYDVLFFIMEVYTKPRQPNQLIWYSPSMDLGKSIFQFVVTGLQTVGMVLLLQNPYAETTKILARTWKIFYRSIGHYIMIQFVCYAVNVTVVKVGVWLFQRFKGKLYGIPRIVVLVSMLVLGMVVLAYKHTALIVLTLERIHNYENIEKKQEGLQ